MNTGGCMVQPAPGLSEHTKCACVAGSRLSADTGRMILAVKAHEPGHSHIRRAG